MQGYRLTFAGLSHKMELSKGREGRGVHMPQHSDKEQMRRLAELCLRCTEISEKGFAVDLRKQTQQWQALVSALGRRQAYRLMSRTLCEAYRQRFGREFLFSESCVAFELAYHADAYFWTQGFRHPGRHLTTLLFAREELARHCEVIDISTDDVAVFKQSAMFGYAAGVRPCYRKTPQDPFERPAFGLPRPKRKRDTENS